MAIEFRCEKCDELLSTDAEPGALIRCAHCGKKLNVPAVLGSLPRPQVPTGASGSAGQTPPDLPAANETQPEGSDAMMSVMAALMPWVLSIFFHLGLGLIMGFLVMIVHKTLPEDVVVPQVLSDDPRQTMAVDAGSRRPQQRRRRTAAKSYTRRETAIKDTGKTRKRVILGGGASSGASQTGFGMTGGGKVNFFGGGAPGPMGTAFHIVYVIDRSGSMEAGGVFDAVQSEMMLSIGRLKDVQDFHIIFFAEDKTIENPPRRLVPANEKQKLGVVDFLNGVSAQGRTTVLPALKRAFAVLSRADVRRKGKLILLLTDGQFAGIGGGSRHKELSGNKAVIQWLRDNNTKGNIHVSTYLYGNDPEARKVMQLIAHENRGNFKLISGDE